MKAINLVFVFIIFAGTILGQPELKPGQHKGYILTKDGKQEGIIWLEGSLTRPWQLQKKISFITEDGFAKLEKNKAKYFTDYKAKEILGYGFDDIVFEAVKFADLSAVGPDMLAKMYFMRVLVSGKLSVYKYYRTPPTVLSGSDVNKTDEEWAEDNELVIKKGDEKSKTAESVEMVELIEDCPAVKEKYLSGGYGFEPSNDGSKSGLKKVFAKMGDRAKIEESIISIAQEYNQCK